MEEDIFHGIEIPEEEINWKNIQFTKSYGVGIDTHRDFIQVCVLLKDFIFNQKKYVEISENLDKEGVAI